MVIMLINQYMSFNNFVFNHFTVPKNVKTLQKTKQETFEEIALNPVNQLMMESEIKKLKP